MMDQDDEFNNSLNKFANDTDSTDQDSLDEKIELEQRIRNSQLWASFQNTASCITKLYNDKAQHHHHYNQYHHNQSLPSSSPWVPFQNAASNLATLYKDCIESQRKFAKIGYQHGRRRKMRELTKLLIKHKIPTKVLQKLTAAERSDHNLTSSVSDSAIISSSTGFVGYPTVAVAEGSSAAETTPFGQQDEQQQHNSTTNMSSILNVNQLNLGSDDVASSHHQLSQMGSYLSTNANQLSSTTTNTTTTTTTTTINNNATNTDNNQANLQILLGNTNEEDLFTFQQALAQPAISSAGRTKTFNQQLQHNSRRPCSNSSGYLNTSRPMVVNEASKSEEERLLELNQFLTEEYHKHVGSRKRSCSSVGGDAIKRHRE